MKRKKAYLTIDDAPSEDFKDKVDFLYRKNIPAIFFCIGENLLKYKDVVIYAIKKGFVIGNHSYSHRYFSDLSIDDCKSEIQKTDEIIDELYKKSGIKRKIKLFKFPHFDKGGDVSSKEYEEKWSQPQNKWFIYKLEYKHIDLQSFLKKLGYVQPGFQYIDTKWFADKNMLKEIDVRCTFDQMEYWLDINGAPWGMDKENSILGRIDENVPYEGRSLNCLDTSDIILVHDHKNTTALFYKIINLYIKKNIEFLKI